MCDSDERLRLRYAPGERTVGNAFTLCSTFDPNAYRGIKHTNEQFMKEAEGLLYFLRGVAASSAFAQELDFVLYILAYFIS